MKFAHSHMMISTAGNTVYVSITQHYNQKSLSFLIVLTVCQYKLHVMYLGT